MNIVRTTVLLLLWSIQWSAMSVAEPMIVENGQPRAQIVIDAKPQRSVRIAADDLQTYIEKITGAHVPIVTEPAGDAIKLFVGRSAHTDRLGIKADELKFGAYRLVSGDDWMVFIGDDTEFVPVEPYPKSRNEMTSGSYLAELDKLTGDTLGHPHVRLFMDKFTLPGTVGLPDALRSADAAAPLEGWTQDERGSLNAVCGFLYRLGVRWYLPGDLGEVVPQTKSIALPKVDEVVKPDFPLRAFSVKFGEVSPGVARWAMRLGVREPHVLFGHGLSYMTMRDEVFQTRPEWFALYGGKRNYVKGSTKNKLCLSQESMFEATVKYCRILYDHFGYTTVAVMPADGYVSICQCPLCKGKDQPERGYRGVLSNHVWDFVNRVAKELGKTHPDRTVSCCAYGAYQQPPTNIDKLEPNVEVMIVGGRRPKSGVAAQGEIRALRESWYPKTGRPIAIWENYPPVNRGWYMPAFMARTIGSSINDTKGHSVGEAITVSFGQKFEKVGLGFNHFQIYFTAQMYWGGPQRDPGALLEEYCRLFYGPAGDQMLAFFDYCEPNWTDMESDKTKCDQALALFDQAKARVDAESTYGQRVALIDTFLERLRRKTAQLAQTRGAVPKLRFNGPAGKIVIDGKLDEEYWGKTSRMAGRLRECQTGTAAALGTSVMAGWTGSDLYLAIRCDERPGDELHITATKNEDAAIWMGDFVEVALATDAHSYYQIAVNPVGAKLDLDRGVEKSSWALWDSQAEVATSVAPDHWIVEMRIPVTQDENDPLNLVVGKKPSVSLPWFINVGRHRDRDSGGENTALSPTGLETWHKEMKFAHLYEGNAHEFEADPTVTDFVIELRQAQELASQKEHAQVIEKCLAMTDAKLLPRQASEALRLAVGSALAMKDFKQAGDLARRIPVAEQSKAALMSIDLAQGRHQNVLETYGSEDLSKWPFWAAADGYYARGVAYRESGDNAKAAADFKAALVLTADNKLRKRINAELERLSGGK